MIMWPHMNCPNCNKAISFWSIRRQFNCQHCKTSVVAENFKTSMLVGFGAWGVIGTPIMWTLFCDGPYVVAADIIGGIFFVAIACPHIVKLKQANEPL